MHGAQREPEQKERGDDAGNECHDHRADKGPEVGRAAAPACGQHREGGEEVDDHDGGQHRVGDEGDPVRKTHQDHQHRVEVEQRGLGVQRLRHGGRLSDTLPAMEEKKLPTRWDMPCGMAITPTVSPAIKSTLKYDDLYLVVTETAQSHLLKKPSSGKSRSIEQHFGCSGSISSFVVMTPECFSFDAGVTVIWTSSISFYP